MKKIIGPSLKVVVTKGPSSGFSSEFPARVKVNVGRVVKGNKVTIKDAGISSNHLSIQFDSGSGHWTLTDLGSSNGTVLNSKPIEPNTAYRVEDGDVIKIGEETLIRFGIVRVEEEEFGSVSKRVTRRSVKEDVELGLGFGEGLGKKEVINQRKVGRGRPPKSRDIAVGIEEEKELEVGIVEEKACRDRNDEVGKEGERVENLGGNEVNDAGIRRVTRGSRRKGNDGGENGEGIGDVGIGRVTRGGRVTRSSRIQEMSEIRGYDDRDAGDMDVVGNGEGIGDAGIGRVSRGGRITRSSRIQEMSEIRGYDDGDAGNMDVVGKGRGKGRGKSQKRMCATSVENCGLGVDVVEGGLAVNSEVVDGRSRSTKVRNKLEVEVEAPERLENEQIREEEMGVKSHLQEGDCLEGENNREGDKVESLQENVCGAGSSDLKRTNLSVLGRLEKMTFGQWLDYIEEYLPKQIVAETEEMITEMRHKAEKFHEFMLQQKAAKGGGDIQ